MNIANSPYITSRGQPADMTVVPDRWRSNLPEYCAVLAHANGLELHGGLLRLFGAGDDCLGRDGVKWNQCEWRASYELPDDIVLWGESIFGDQFGVHSSTGALLLLNCEGGALETLALESLSEYLENVTSSDPGQWLNIDLVRGAVRQGLRRPSLYEHLSFVVPLVCGGDLDEKNLEVIDGAAHLDVLGQIIAQNRGIPSGTPIRGFAE